jgi:hypothetical protein
MSASRTRGQRQPATVRPSDALACPNSSRNANASAKLWKQYLTLFAGRSTYMSQGRAYASMLADELRRQYAPNGFCIPLGAARRCRATARGSSVWIWPSSSPVPMFFPGTHVLPRYSCSSPVLMFFPGTHVLPRYSCSSPVLMFFPGTHENKMRTFVSESQPRPGHN